MKADIKEMVMPVLMVDEAGIFCPLKGSKHAIRLANDVLIVSETDHRDVRESHPGFLKKLMQHQEDRAAASDPLHDVAARG
jgi:ABC-type taurine transport system ATPase subunit